MVFETILKYLPMSDNMKVLFGTSSIIAVSYYTLISRGACTLLPAISLCI